MKNKLILLVLMLATFEVATAQITMPAASPAGKVYSKVGLTDVEITYFRPKMKGRQIFGEGTDFLVPFGQMWRTGANSGTIITTSDDLMVGGQNLPAGEYMILSVPAAGSWDVIFYNDKSIGGNVANYKKEDEQLRVKGTVGKLTEAVEALTFNIADLSADNTTAAIELAWENTSVKVEVKTDFDKVVMEQIAQSTKVNPNNYAAAAGYYFETGRDLDQAIEWMDMYLEANPKAFWNIYRKAEMLAKKGDKKSIKAAIETAEKSIEIAKASGNDFGYIKRNEDLIAELSK
jgi:tetratricopeptide (TPR) repeat protein